MSGIFTVHSVVHVDYTLLVMLSILCHSISFELTRQMCVEKFHSAVARCWWHGC